MEEMQMENTQAESTKIEGRNAVLEAFRSGKTIDKLFVLDGCKDGPIQTILREAKKHDTLVQFVAKERLEQLSETKKHQGVIAMAAAFSYATVEDILENARKKNEAPLSFCWIILKTRTIWAQLSVLPIWQVPMASLFQSVVQWD